MIGEILDALCGELQELFVTTNTTVLRDTQVKQDNMALYSIPIIILRINNSPDQYQMIGGGTMCDWEFEIGAYFYDINSELSDDSGYSASAYDLIDTIRRHIALRKWKTTAMTTITTDYNFKLTLNGIPKAATIQQENGGILPGYAINYDSVAIDPDTNWTIELTATANVLQGIEYFDNTLAPKIIWQGNVLAVKTAAQYAALTGQNIGNRYYISDTKKIAQVLTIDVHGTPSSSTLTTLALNMAFFNDGNIGYCYYFDGTNINIINQGVICEISP